MEPAIAPGNETFRISAPSQGSPVLVPTPPSPTQSMHTEIDSATDSSVPTERTIEYTKSAENQTFLVSASTNGSFRTPTGSPPMNNGGPLSSNPYRKSFEISVDDFDPSQDSRRETPVGLVEGVPDSLRPGFQELHADAERSKNGSTSNTGIFDGLSDDEAIAQVIRKRMGSPIRADTASDKTPSVRSLRTVGAEKDDDGTADDRSSTASRGRQSSHFHVIDVSSGRPWLVNTRSGSQAKLVEASSSRASSVTRSIQLNPLGRPGFSKSKAERMLGISGHIVTLRDLEAGLVSGEPTQGRESLIPIDPGTPREVLMNDNSTQSRNASITALPPTPAAFTERASITAIPPTPSVAEPTSPGTGSTYNPSARKHSRVNSTLMYEPYGRKASQANSSLLGYPSSPTSSEHASTRAIPPHSASASTSQPQSIHPPPSNLPRKVSHAPPPINTKSHRHSLFQSIARTPYPFSKKNSTRKPPLSASASSESTLILSLQSNNAAVPKLAKIIVPGRDEFNPAADSPTKTKHFTGLDFDDEALFKVMRNRYRKTRGFLRRLLSLRGLKSISILSSPNRHPPLRKDSEKPFFRNQSSTSSTGQYSPQQLWAHYRKPKLGRGHYDWVDWVHRLPSNSVQGEQSGDKVALEFVEGWRVGLLFIAVLVLSLVSVAAAVLWVILGLGNGEKEGYMNAGGRVETGVVLAGVVLMMGWTGVGAWGILSWLLG
ncbi:MAG: hypothetical protein M1812_007376 [Candelaria pacifica]|nr:MAG: hypothetical protein M1812_007376 [Candelaria pacifica]